MAGRDEPSRPPGQLRLVDFRLGMKRAPPDRAVIEAQVEARRQARLQREEAAKSAADAAKRPVVRGRGRGGQALSPAAAARGRGKVVVVEGPVVVVEGPVVVEPKMRSGGWWQASVKKINGPQKKKPWAVRQGRPQIFWSAKSFGPLRYPMFQAPFLPLASRIHPAHASLLPVTPWPHWPVCLPGEYTVNSVCLPGCPSAIIF
jgi:hypothetical protein